MDNFLGDAGAHVKSALSFIEEQLPGVYVKSLQIGETIAEVLVKYNASLAIYIYK